MIITRERARRSGRIRSFKASESTSENMIMRPRVQRSRSALERYRYQDEYARANSFAYQAWTKSQRARQLTRHGTRVVASKITQRAMRGSGRRIDTGMFARAANGNPMTQFASTALYALTTGLLNYAGSSQAEASEMMNSWFLGNLDDDQRGRQLTMNQAKSSPELMAWLGQMSRSGRGDQGMGAIHTAFFDQNRVNIYEERGKSLLRQEYPELTQADMLTRRIFDIIKEGDYSPLEHLAEETEKLFSELYNMITHGFEQKWQSLKDAGYEMVEGAYKKVLPHYNALKKSIGWK